MKSKKSDAKVRPRYATSTLESYPSHLETHKYVRCEEERSLVFDEKHDFGSLVDILDFRYWGNLNDSINSCINKCMTLKVLDVSNNTEVNETFIKLIGNFSQTLHTLKISNCPNLTSAAIDHLAKLINITNIDISKTNSIQDRNIDVIVQNLNQLQNFNISHCILLTDVSLQSISDYANNIQILNASNNPNFTHKGVYILLNSCDTLLDLDLRECSKLTFIGMVISYSGMIQHVSKTLHILKVSNNILQKDSIDWICSALPQLKQLEIAKVPFLSHSQISALLSTTSLLQVLNFNHCKDLNAETLILIARKTPQLREISLASVGAVNSASVVELLSRCAHLTALDVSGNTAIDDQAFLPHTQSSISLNITKLIAGGCSLTSIGVSAIGHRCILLTHLDISSTTTVTDDGIAVIASRCSQLKECILFDCLSLSDRCIQALCILCKSLLVLNIGTSVTRVDAWGTRVRQYSDQAIEYILKFAKKLITLNIQNQCGISFTSPYLNPSSSSSTSLSGRVRRGFTGHFHLQKIDLYGVDEISALGAINVFSQCYFLREAILPGNNEVLLPQEKIRRALSKIDNVSRDQMNAAQRLLHAERYDLRTIGFWKAAFGHLPYCRANSRVGYNGLQLCHLSSRVDSLSYRDDYYQRKIHERWAVRVIALCYRLNKLRRVVIVRGLYWKKKKALLVMKLMKVRMEGTNRLKQRLAAKIIQKEFRKSFYPRMLACKRIQRNFRKYLTKKKNDRFELEKTSATLIQRVIRGVLLRLSDRYILSQIYIKLPPFWRDILNSAPNKVTRSKIDKGQIQQLRDQTGDMVSHIIENIARDGVLASKLPVLIPQPFDKQPYVSLNDGRKMGFFSDRDTILNQSGVSTVHTFNLPFWPLTRPSKPVDTDVTIFDPSQDGFDVKSRKPDLITCAICASKMRAVWCQSCRRGYCFLCAFRIHAEPTRRRHNLALQQPREIAQKPAPSLVHFLNNAEKATFDLRYVIKHLRSAAEIQRVKDERRLALEMEKEARRREIEAQKAMLVETTKHDAVTRIACRFRVRKALQAVIVKRHHHALHDAREEAKRFHLAAGKIQRTFRRYSTRKWFISKGIKFDLNRVTRKRRKPGQAAPGIDRNELDARIDKEVTARRVAHRSVQSTKLLMTYTDTIEMLETNISYWLKQDETIPPKIALLTQLRDKIAQEFKDADISLSKARNVVSHEELSRMDINVKALHQKSKSMSQRLESVTNQRWWISQILRSSHRRLCILRDRFQDTMKAMEWVVVESALEIRQKADAEPSLTLASNWLKEYVSTARLHQKTLDIKQEVLILDEISKIQHDQKKTQE
eukprot:gene2468-4790_t